MKRINILLLFVLLLAMGLFFGYLSWSQSHLDVQAPVLSASGELLQLSVKDPEQTLLQGVTAFDARDGDVTAGILIESVFGIRADGLSTVTYAAFDGAGNVGKLQRPIRYTDYIPPRFCLDRAMIFTAERGFDLMDSVGAYDVRDGDISRRVRATLVSDTQRIDAPGTHQVLLQVTNSLGDTASLTIPVTVRAEELHTAQVELSAYLIYLDRGAYFEPRDYLQTFTAREETVKISNGGPDDIHVQIDDSVNPDVPGVYEVSYLVSRSVDSVTDTGITKLIVVVN